MFISQTHASALVFNHYVSYVYFVYIIYDLVINVKQTTNKYFCVVLVAQFTGLSKLLYCILLSELRDRYGLVTQLRLA